MSQYGENQSTGSKVTGALGSLFGAGKKSDNNNPSSDYGSAAAAAPHDGSYDQRNNTRGGGGGGGGSGTDSAGAGPGATNMQQSSNQESHQQQQQKQQAYNGTPQGGTGPASGQQQQQGRFHQPAGGAYGNQAGQEQLGYGAGRGGGGGGGGGVVYQGLDRGGGGGGYGTQLGGPQDKYAAAAPPNSGVANQGAGYNGMQQGPQAGYRAPMSAASGNPEAGYGMQQGPQAGYGAPMGGAGGNPGAGYGAPIWRGGGGGGGGGGNQGGASFQSQPGYGTLTRESQTPYQEAAGSYQPQPSGYGTQGTQAPNQGAQGYQPQGVVGNQGGPGQGPPTGYEKDEDRNRPNNQQQQQQQGQPGAGGGFPVDSGYGNTAAIAPGLFITIAQSVPGQQGGDAAYASSYPYQGGNQAPNQGGQLQGGANPREMEPSSGSGAAKAFGNQAPSQGMGQQQHQAGFGGIPQYGTLQDGGRQQGPPNPVSDASLQMTAPYGFQDGPRRYQEQQGGTAPAGALAGGVGAAGLAGPHGSNNTGYYGQHATTAANHQPSQDTGAGKERQQQQQFSGDNLENTQPGATGTTQSATHGAGNDTPHKPSLGEQIQQPDNNTAGNAPSGDNTTGAPNSSSGLPQSDGAGKTTSTPTPTPTSSTTKAAGTGNGSPMPDSGTSGGYGTTSDVGKKKSGGLVSKIKDKLHI